MNVHSATVAPLRLPPPSGELSSLVDDFFSVPQTIRAIPNWCGWKLVSRSDKPGEFTKPPCSAKTGEIIGVNEKYRDQFVTFEEAVEAVRKYNLDGIGFVFTGVKLAGIDFDGCVQPDGTIDPYAAAILKLMGNPWTEYSPSGKGLHTIVACDEMPVIKMKDKKTGRGIEFYHGLNQTRYFTVTGRKLDGAGDTIPHYDKFGFFHLLLSQYMNTEFTQLWVGDTSKYGDDHSKADFALMCKLAKLFGNDANKMEVVFGLSALASRDKWKERDDYRSRTISRAIEQNQQPNQQPTTEPERVEPTVAKKSEKPAPANFEALELNLVLASDVRPRAQDWLWENKIPRNHITGFVGEPDKGKGVVSIDVIARSTTGREMADGTPNQFNGQPIEVMMLVGEDDLETTVVPRLIQAGADLTKIHFVQSISKPSERDKNQRQLYFDTDLAAVKKSLLEHPQVKLVVIDPISNYLGETNTDRDREVRKVLAPVKDLAAELKVTFLFIAHFNKNTASSAINRTGGSIALTALPRASWCFVRDPENPDQYMMLKVKKNVGKRAKGLCYKIVEDFISVPDVAEPISVPKLVWGSETDKTADDILQTVQDPEMRGQVKARKFLEAFLANGPVLSAAMWDASRVEGIDEHAIKRVKPKLGVQSQKIDDRWFMRTGKEIAYPTITEARKMWDAYVAKKHGTGETLALDSETLAFEDEPESEPF